MRDVNDFIPSQLNRSVSEWQTLFRNNSPQAMAAVLRGDLGLIRISFPVAQVQDREREAILRYTEAIATHATELAAQGDDIVEAF